MTQSSEGRYLPVHDELAGGERVGRETAMPHLLELRPLRRDNVRHVEAAEHVHLGELARPPEVRVQLAHLLRHQLRLRLARATGICPVTSRGWWVGGNI
eukprot:1176186-Prorocentrum_minimum.AAC.4